MTPAADMNLQHARPTDPPSRRGRGVQLEDVLTAADALVAQGLKPTIERVRQHLGGGSPNTVSPLLDVWFERLPQRLVGVGAPESRPQMDGPPLAVLQAAQQFWEVARRESEQAQIQLSEATRRELELQREALTQKEADLARRESAFGEARTKLDDALAASKAALAALQDQMHTQQQESARLLAESEAEVRRLRKAHEEALGSKEALRETMGLELAKQQRATEQAEERHQAHERRLMSELDRERVATRQAGAELAKEQKARATDRDASRAAAEKAEHALVQAQAKHRDEESTWSRQLQALQVEQATLRERAAGAEQRAGDLVAQLLRQQEQAQQQIAQLRESQATTAAALRQLQARHDGRPSKGKKPAE